MDKLIQSKWGSPRKSPAMPISTTLTLGFSSEKPTGFPSFIQLDGWNPSWYCAITLPALGWHSGQRRAVAHATSPFGGWSSLAIKEQTAVNYFGRALDATMGEEESNLKKLS